VIEELATLVQIIESSINFFHLHPKSRDLVTLSRGSHATFGRRRRLLPGSRTCWHLP
jgi:hypothetical protein